MIFNFRIYLDNKVGAKTDDVHHILNLPPDIVTYLASFCLVVFWVFHPFAGLHDSKDILLQLF
jgi:hypothetical protein